VDKRNGHFRQNSQISHAQALGNPSTIIQKNLGKATKANQLRKLSEYALLLTFPCLYAELWHGIVAGSIRDSNKIAAKPAVIPMTLNRNSLNDTSIQGIAKSSLFFIMG
jgi:hypothetical protein